MRGMINWRPASVKTEELDQYSALGAQGSNSLRIRVLPCPTRMQHNYAWRPPGLPSGNMLSGCRAQNSEHGATRMVIAPQQAT